MLTAMGGKESYLEGMNAGADDFLTKPVDADTLNARLRVAERLLGLQEQVSQMEELLPICAYCKKIRDGRDEWQDLQQYVGSRTEASFQSEVCPECHAKEPL
jgi:DNA-binding response OmpR family regulator